MSERKYRQRGYQDTGRDDDRGSARPGRTAPGSRREGPRGRGLGKPTATVFRCAVCGSRQVMGEVELDATCGQCGADLHTCTHCQHFDPAAPKECRQPVEERVRAKAKRNDCRLFSPKATQEFAREAARPDDPRSAFDALFKI